MPLRGNKGEWSELYVFFRLLADGKLHSGDGNLNAVKGREHPIVKVFRDDAPDRLVYKVDKMHKKIQISGAETDFCISQRRFLEEAENLLNFIKSITGTSQEFPEIESFLNEIKVDKIKAKSNDKADIRIVVHNLRNDTEAELGYSIKSRLGGASTLINSNRDGSNFLFLVKNFSKNRVSAFNDAERFRKKFEILKNAGGSIEFKKVCSPEFCSNLLMLDCCMPELIGECLKIYYSGRAHYFNDVEKILSEENPLKLDLEYQPLMYQYKLKQFLLAFALGMTPSTPWDARFNANGGYIVVKETGDIVCYHFFDRNDLEDYLFNNSFFDTPSMTRHNFGEIYTSDEGTPVLKLNIQVRFR